MDRDGGDDITIVDCGTSTSQEDCNITAVDFWMGGSSGITVSGVWIGTWGAVSGCVGNLNLICSGPGLFTGVGDEEQRRALV